MKIAVGTKNPSKLCAVEDAFKALYPDTLIECIGVDVPSGVSEQPMNDDETMFGAQNRAQEALIAVKDANYGVGLEGGLHQVQGTWFTGNFASVVSRSGLVGFGISPRVAVPEELIQKVKSGVDLSKAFQAVFGIAEIGKKEGLLGYMTNGVITRASASKDAIIAAMGQVRHLESSQG